MKRNYKAFIAVLLSVCLLGAGLGGAYAADTIGVGDTVLFGSYRQGVENTAYESPYWELEWTVLAISGDTALLLSAEALECMPYHTSWADVTWATCSLRSWLNGTFIANAFDTGETGAMISTVVNTPAAGNTGSTITTIDRVFLLSAEEAAVYLPADDSRKALATTAVAEETAASLSADGYAYWWLRSPGSDGKHAGLVTPDGALSAELVNWEKGCVRPALWVKTSALTRVAAASGGEITGLTIDKLSTRSGPGTQYRDTGTYKVKGEYVKILTLAYDANGVCWVQCEVPYGKTMRRVYTGLKRFDTTTFAISSVPEETPLNYRVKVITTSKAKYGPGDDYGTYSKLTVDKGQSVTIIALENDYAQVEWTTTKQSYRAWVRIAMLDY